MENFYRTGTHKTPMHASKVCGVYKFFRNITSIIIRFMER